MKSALPQRPQRLHAAAQAVRAQRSDVGTPGPLPGRHELDQSPGVARPHPAAAPLPRDHVRLNRPPVAPTGQVDERGLRLSIARHIIEKLGGWVGVESEGSPGRGTIFSFTLPSA